MRYKQGLVQTLWHDVPDVSLSKRCVANSSGMPCSMRSMYVCSVCTKRGGGVRASIATRGARTSTHTHQRLVAIRPGWVDRNRRWLVHYHLRVHSGHRALGCKHQQPTRVRCAVLTTHTTHHGICVGHDLYLGVRDWRLVKVGLRVHVGTTITMRLPWRPPHSPRYVRGSRCSRRHESRGPPARFRH